MTEFITLTKRKIKSLVMILVTQNITFELMLHACTLTNLCFLGIFFLFLPRSGIIQLTFLLLTIRENERLCKSSSYVYWVLSQNIPIFVVCFFMLNFGKKNQLTQLVRKTVILLLSQYIILKEEEEESEFHCQGRYCC